MAQMNRVWLIKNKENPEVTSHILNYTVKKKLRIINLIKGFMKMRCIQKGFMKI